MTVPETVQIPAGTFVMGYSGPKAGTREAYLPHEVTLDAFRIGVSPVTNREFAQFVKEGAHITDAEAAGESFVPEQKLSIRGACWNAPGGPGTNVKKSMDLPVVHVSWQDATKYCEWLSKSAGAVVRLPTEAEWEHAARGPENSEYPWGDSFDPKKTNCREGGKGRLSRSTETPANAWGLHDMGGNVRQWCWDVYEKGYYADSPRKNPKGPEGPASASRVIRGASFLAWRGWAIERLDSPPYYSTSDLGFRVVIEA